MVTRLTSLHEVAEHFGAIVLDQWGVLHDGTTPYPGALDALAALSRQGVRLAVLSNSGKRAAPNAARIGAMGFDASNFELVMTSGEALWSDIADGEVAVDTLYPIERGAGDAADWAHGLDVALCDSPEAADGILLMGLPDDAVPDSAHHALDVALHRDVPVYCTNPDRTAPRAGGVTVVSPGSLAHAHQDQGGRVCYYGKPHLPVFRAVEAQLGVAPNRLLMVGDSLAHDIAGGDAAGWSTAFVEGGLYARHFAGTDDPCAALRALAASQGACLPTFTLSSLR